MPYKKLIALLSVVALSACASLTENVTPKVVKAVNLYCDEPQDARAVVRANVNDALTENGHAVRVDCAGDQ